MKNVSDSDYRWLFRPFPEKLWKENVSFIDEKIACDTLGKYYKKKIVTNITCDSLDYFSFFYKNFKEATTPPDIKNSGEETSRCPRERFGVFYHRQELTGTQ